MKKIILQKVICENCDDYTELIDYNSGKVLLYGDSYHNKINEQIDGFIKGLELAGAQVEYKDSLLGVGICECE